MEKMKKLALLTTGTLTALLAGLLASNLDSSHLFEVVGVRSGYEVTVNLVNELEGKTEKSGVVEFTKNNYTFKFAVSDATFSDGVITIKQGGYLRNITAYNGLTSIAATSDETFNLRLGTGDYENVDKTAEVIDAVSGTFTVSATHFMIYATEDVEISNLTLKFTCSYEGIVTDESTTFSYGWKLNGFGTEDKPYLIENDVDFETISKVTGNRTSDSESDDLLSGKFIKLMYSPVFENADKDKFTFVNFAGNFDGNENTIKINNWSFAGNTRALFRRTTDGAVIKNLTMAGSISGTGTNSNNFGGLIGIVKGNTTLENITNNCKVSTKGQQAGGLIGSVEAVSGKSLLVKNCVNNATVNAESERAGGITGDDSGYNSTYENCTNKAPITAKLCAAGIAGSNLSTIANSSTVFDTCTNTGKITTSNSKDGYSGGICGLTKGVNLTVKDCVNEGEVTQSNTNTCGGIIAAIKKDKDSVAFNSLTVTGCRNGSSENDKLGYIHSKTGIADGGIIGWVNCAIGTIVFENNVNYGQIGDSSLTSTKKTGGLIGAFENNNITIKGCANYGKVYANGKLATKQIGSSKNDTTAVGTFVGFYTSGKVIEIKD